MALCHNCDDARIEYTGNGSQVDYTFPFEYNERTDVAVAYYSEEVNAWIPQPSGWSFLNDTTLRFDVAPTNNQTIIIYRCTDLTPLPAEFYPGTAIKAQELNDNFFVLQSAIEETRCEVERLSEESDDRYWNTNTFGVTPSHAWDGKPGQTVFSTQTWVDSDEAVATTEAITDRIEEKIDERRVTKQDVQLGNWIHEGTNDSDTQYPTTAASSERHDPYFQPSLPYNDGWRVPGKLWFDNDNVLTKVWDQENGTWISSGLSGPPGPIGPTGTYATIVSDDAPTRRIDETDLQNGDIWFNSSTGQLFLYYDDGNPDDARGKQWIQALGGKGATGADGADGVDGATGPQGLAGPAGAVIVSDTPPTNYPALGENASRSLEPGDLWFDSNYVMLYVYYVDSNGPGQWVAVSKTGPSGSGSGSGGGILSLLDDQSPQLGGDLDVNNFEIRLYQSTELAPSVNFLGDNDGTTGIYSPSAGTIGISTSGSTAFTVDATAGTTVNSGHLTVSSGDVNVNSGNVNISNNLTLTTGDATITAGDVVVTAGNVVATAGSVTATSFSGDGSSVTNLDAANLSSGTIPDARFPATLPATSGANLTSLNASELASGTIPDARFPATLPAISGANLTNLNASNLASGTVPDARFPATLPAVDGSNLTNVNATTLDSIDSTSFLRSDATDQKTSGTLRFNDNVLLTFGNSDDGRLFHSGSHQYLDIYTGNFYIRDSTTTRFTFDDNGTFTATAQVAGATLQASSSANNVFIGNFNNYAGASTAYGINVRAGSSTVGTLMQWRNGSNTPIGSIYFSGGTVYYGPFTAHHPCILVDGAHEYPHGTLLEVVEVLEDLENSEGEVIQGGIYYRVQKSQSSHSRKLLGAYGSRLETPNAPEDGNWHAGLILGDGHILVNNSGGNIEVGDGITSSATPGIGQKATETPSMIIGIAQEAVTFTDDTEEKLVAVQYGVQQFIPWS